MNNFRIVFYTFKIKDTNKTTSYTKKIISKILFKKHLILKLFI